MAKATKKKPINLSVLFHGLEIVGILLIIKGIDLLFPGLLPSETIRDGVLVVFGTLLKYIRTSDTLPIDDYVNGKG